MLKLINYDKLFFKGEFVILIEGVLFKSGELWFESYMVKEYVDYYIEIKYVKFKKVIKFVVIDWYMKMGNIYNIYYNID